MFNQVPYKKTYLMNQVLFIGSTLLLVFSSTDIYSKYGMFMFFGVLSFMSVMTFTENDEGSLWNVSLLINLILLLSGFITLSLLIYKDPSNHFDINMNREKYIYMTGFLWVVSGINLKSLFKIKNTKEYLKNTPYWILIIVLLISVLSQVQPYIPDITRQLRELYSFVLVVLLFYKFIHQSLVKET